MAENVCGNCVCENGWCLVERLYDKGGIGVLCFLFIAYIFYRMVWKVWQAAMKSKDDEIERLIDERNDLQDKVFPERETSESNDKQIAGRGMT